MAEEVNGGGEIAINGVGHFWLFLELIFLALVGMFC